MRWNNMLVVIILLLSACAPEPISSDLHTPGTESQTQRETTIDQITETALPVEGATPTSPARMTSNPSPSPSPPPAPSLTETTEPVRSPAFQLVTTSNGLPGGKISDVWISPQGQVWVGKETGIFVYQDGSWEQIYDGATKELLGDDGDGRVWVVLGGGAAIAAYKPPDSWQVYGPDEGWLELPPPEYLSPGFGDGFVSDPQGNLWLATGLDDLRRFDPASQTWQVLRAADIGFAPPEQADYQGHFLTDVALSPDQEVWVGDCVGMGEALKGQGVRSFNGTSWSAIPHTAGQCVFDIEIDHSNRMWVAGFDALMVYDPESRQWSDIPLPPWERTQLVHSIDLDQEGNSWVEIMRFGGASAFGEIARYHLWDEAWVEDFTGPFSSLAVDESGAGWLCSGGDVFRLENGEKEALGRVDSNYCEIYVDGKGRVWISSAENLWWYEL